MNEPIDWTEGLPEGAEILCESGVSGRTPEGEVVVKMRLKSDLILTAKWTAREDFEVSLIRASDGISGVIFDCMCGNLSSSRPWDGSDRDLVRSVRQYAREYNDYVEEREAA